MNCIRIIRYITETFLYFRLRMCLLYYLMLRTSGYLNNLSQESKKKTLTENGVENLFEAYYLPYKNVLFKFKHLAPTKIFGEMFAFFKANFFIIKLFLF